MDELMDVCVSAHEYELQSFVKKYKEILSADTDEQIIKMCLCFQFVMQNQNIKKGNVLGKFTVFYTRHVQRHVPVCRLKAALHLSVH